MRAPVTGKSKLTNATARKPNLPFISPVPVCTDADWIEERVRSFPTGNVLYPIIHEVAVRHLLLKRYLCSLRTSEQHLKHFQLMLTFLRNAGVTRRLKRCSYFADTVNYLGHVIRPDKFKIENSTIEGIQKLHDPATHTETQSFLGLCNVFRRFISNF